MWETYFSLELFFKLVWHKELSIGFNVDERIPVLGKATQNNKIGFHIPAGSIFVKS